MHSRFVVCDLLSPTSQVVGYIPPNVVLGLAFFYGGGIQMLAGMWEMAQGNTFGATACVRVE